MARPAPIFVVGVARSGTTLLQALLGAHPHIAAPPEMHWFLRIYHQRDYWGELDSPAGIRRVVAATLDMPGDMLDDIRIDADDVMEHLSGADVTYPRRVGGCHDDIRREARKEALVGEDAASVPG